MTLFVDTSVWSLAFRCDAVPDVPQVNALKHALESGQAITKTGFILQDLLQGFTVAKVADKIIDRFSHIPCSYQTGMITLRRRSCIMSAVEQVFNWAQLMPSLPNSAFAMS